MGDAKISVALVWFALPILTFVLAAAAHAGWLFASWVLR